MQEAQLEVAPPFRGPVPVSTQRGLGTFEAITSFALAGLGIGFGIAAFRRMRKIGKIQCAPEMLEDAGYGMPIVGVDVNYEGDWWKDRGERLYWQARRQGATTAEQIGLAIIAADIGSYSECMGQFPPHSNTHPQNVELWQNLMSYVQQQMAEERGLA
jgi:hypothetical protein